MKKNDNKIKWEMRNGKIIGDKKMISIRLNAADLYDGKVKSYLPVKINHLLAKRIREMTNSEFNRHFGVAVRKFK